MGQSLFRIAELQRDYQLSLIENNSHTQSGGSAPAKFVQPELDGARLDKAVKLHFGLPWAKARTWIDTGKVFLDGNCVAEQSHSVEEGQRIELRMSEPKKRPEPKLDPRAVIYFDEEIIVVDKAAGVMTVPHPDSDEVETLDRLALEFLRAKDPKAKSNRASLGVVHRIDKDTSGLVVFARTHNALKSLTEQFRAHSIERRYLAIVHGNPSAQKIETRIVRNTGEGLRGSVEEGATNAMGEPLGRYAVTHLEIVEKLEGATLVSCRIETGRTHQIRIHLSEIGHPIVGEKVYIRDYQGVTIPAVRAMLHAEQLGFIHPGTLEQISWTQEPPRDFRGCLKPLRTNRT